MKRNTLILPLLLSTLFGVLLQGCSRPAEWSAQRVESELLARFHFESVILTNSTDSGVAYSGSGVVNGTNYMVTITQSSTNKTMAFHAVSAEGHVFGGAIRSY